MNHKQKLGYMALGAGIMVLGIIIGQVITPNIEAQSDGVFGEIQCTGLKVVDEQGKTAIALSSWESAITGEPINEVSVYGKDKSAVGLYSNYELGSQVYVFDENKKGSVYLAADETGGYVTLYDKHNNLAIRLNAGEQSNEVIVHQKHEKEVFTTRKHLTPQAILLSSNNFDNGGNRVLLNDRAGMPGVALTSAWDSARGAVKDNDVGVFEATGKITRLGD